MNDQERAVIEAARVIAADLADQNPDHLDMNERELLHAVAALDPQPAVGLPEEPPVGSIVLDRDRDIWTRFDEGWDVGTEWSGGYAGVRSWTDLNRMYGPLTHVVPASSRDLAQRLAAALRLNARAHCAEFHGDAAEWSFDGCPQSECQRDRALTRERDEALAELAGVRADQELNLAEIVSLTGRTVELEAELAKAREALTRIADEIPKLDGLDDERIAKGLEWIHRVASEALGVLTPSSTADSEQNSSSTIGVPDRRDRYMMATTAHHALGDISRDEPDLAVIYGETETDYIGEWVAGLGLVNVRFPKATTRELTNAECVHYASKVIDSGGVVKPIVFDPAPAAVVCGDTTAGQTEEAAS